MYNKEIYQYTKLIDASYTAMCLEKDEVMRKHLFDMICGCLEEIKKSVELFYEELNRD